MKEQELENWKATTSDGKRICLFSVDNQKISGQCFEAVAGFGSM